MANALQELQQRILARGMLHLRSRVVMPNQVNRDFSTETAQKGDTINVEIPQPVGVVDVVPSHQDPEPVSSTPVTVPVVLDQWKKNEPFFLTDKEVKEINASERFIPPKVTESVNAIIDYVNIFLWSKYKGVYGATGTAGTTPFGGTTKTRDAINARKILNKQRCPLNPRVGVVDFDAEANMLALDAFADAEKVGNSGVKIEGEIGRKFGVNWMADDHVPFHTAGTASKATVTLISDSEAGDTTITLAVDTGTATVVEGDIIQISGHDQTYVVKKDATLTTTGVEVSISPGLVVDVDGSGTPVEVSVFEDHRVNLVFHRNAFAFATRTLQDALLDTGNSNQSTLTDPLTGLTLRLEAKRQYKQTVWEFDILFGASLIRPELVCRILG